LVPSWTFTLRGKLLPSEPDVPALPMTAYFKSIIIDFDRPVEAYAEPNRVEWHKMNEPGQKMFDYIQCTRKGDCDVNVKVSLTVDTAPEKYNRSLILLTLDTNLMMNLRISFKYEKIQDLEL
jgi:hypothetical protein